MKALAIVFTLLPCLPALAGDISIGSLQGPWWDEDGAVMLDVGDGGFGTLLDCSKQTSRDGRYTLDAGKLAFTGSDGKSQAWTASMDGAFLVLSEGAAASTRWRRETRESREDRCCRIFRECGELTATLGRPNIGEKSADEVQKKIDDLKKTAKTVIRSLAGDKDDAQVKLLDRILARVSPAARDAGKRAAQATDCVNHLKQIGVYIALYEMKKKEYPKDLEALRAPDLVTDESLFRCAASGTEDAYAYAFPDKGDDTPFDAILAYDRDPHPDGTRSVLIFQGRVLRLSDEEFQVGLKSGVAPFIPTVQVKSAKLVETKDGRELVVEASVKGLRVEKKSGESLVRATATIRGAGARKLPYESEAVHIQVASDKQPAEFTVRLRQTDEDWNEIGFDLSVVDENSGNTLSADIDLKR